MQKLIKVLRKPLTSTFLAIIFGVLVAGVVLVCSGYDPLQAVNSLFRGIFSRPKYVFKVIEKSVPIILTGISVAFAFKTGLFNMGAEGQYIIGSVAAMIVGVKLNLPPILQVPIIILTGMLAGAIFGGLVGALKARFGIHEVITGIMFNWIAFYLCNFIVDSDAFHKPNTMRSLSINEAGFTTLFYKWKKSKEGIEYLKQNRWLSDILLKTDVNVGIVVALIVAVIIWILLYKTSVGYGIRAVGHNAKAAEFAGIGVKRNIMAAMLISGAICGLAAALTVTGVSPHAVYKLGMFENVGFNGLFVALIARTSPLGCILSGLFFGALNYGGNALQMDLGIPSEIMSIAIGSILFFVALAGVAPMIANKLAKRGGKKNAK